MTKEFKYLRDYISKHSLTQAAALLGHPNTSRVQRWIREKEIPTRSLGTVSQLLKAKGILK